LALSLWETEDVDHPDEPRVEVDNNAFTASQARILAATINRLADQLGPSPDRAGQP